MSIRLALRDARERAEMTQAALARAIGVRPATISDLENGKSTRIDFALLDLLCGALRVAPGDLLERRAARPRSA